MQIEWEIARDIKIFIDKKLWKVVHKSLFIKKLELLQRARTEKELEDLFAQLETKIAQEASFALLSRRGYFSQELKEKLVQKKLSLPAIESAVSECQRLGFLNDAERAQNMIRSYKNKGMGPRLIAFKLKQKCGARTYSNLETGAVDIARVYLQRRFGTKPLEPKEKQRAFRALQRRGFDLETIYGLLRD